MHDPLRQFDGPRTLDDLLEETEALTGGSQAIFDAGDRLARSLGAAEVIDGTTGPRFQVPRETRVLRAPALDAPLVDDHVTAVEEVIAREDARFGGVGGDPDHVPGGTYDGVEECARGARRVPGTTGGGDRARKKSRFGGRGDTVGPTKMAAEHWDHERAVGGRPRKGKDARERFSVRAEPTTRAAIAQTGMNESDFLAEAAKLVAMARTGAQGEELMRAVIALAGAARTGERGSSAGRKTASSGPPRSPATASLAPCT